jgi:hypothetical protein
MTISKEFLKHNVSSGEFAVYKILSTVDVQAYNENFSTLVLPRAIKVDEASRILTLPYYEGETFNEIWNIDTGGAGMDTSLATTIPLLLKDLITVEPDIFTADNLLAQTPNLAYDHEHAVHYFGSLCGDLTREGIFSSQQHNKAIHLLNHLQTTQPIINNGDFYPRNLIRQTDGKLVLIDWEMWNPHSPFFLIDHPENVAAVQYVHMWGNPEWQAAFRAELDRQFAFEPESFDKGILMKALTLASFFRKHRALFEGQLAILKQLLAAY